MPYRGLVEIDSFSATPIDFGEIIPTFELRNITDVKRDNLTYLWNDGDQPIIIVMQNASTLTDFFPDANTAVYVEYGYEMFSDDDGTNFFRFRDSEDGFTWFTVNLGNYYGAPEGGNTAPNDTDIYTLNDDSPALRRRTVFVVDGIDTSRFQMFLVGTDGNVGTGANIRFYECMFGLDLPLPEGYLVEQRSYKIVNPGAKVFNKFQGTLDKTYLSSFNGRNFSLEFEALTSVNCKYVLDIFKYGYGVLPMLFIEDTTDTSTWRKVILVSAKVTEPVSGAFNVTINCIEVI